MNDSEFHWIELPWHQGRVAQLLQRHQQGRLPHALLFKGPKGTGKLNSARQLAESLLLGGQGNSRELLRAGTHPDFSEIRPAEGKAVIAIDQLRQLRERLGLTAQSGQLKICIIEPAETMTLAAANALLKTLEEPPGDSLLILVSAGHGHLPATVRSRCQEIFFPCPDPATASRWLEPQLGAQTQACLQLANGAPLQALALHQAEFHPQYRQLLSDLSQLLLHKGDVLATAQGWSTFEPELFIDWLTRLTRQVIRQVMNPGDTSSFQSNPLKDLKISTDRIDLLRWFNYLDLLREARREKGANLNRELFIENLLINWSGLTPGLANR